MTSFFCQILGELSYSFQSKLRVVCIFSYYVFTRPWQHDPDVKQAPFRGPLSQLCCYGSGQECRYSTEWLQCPPGASGQECRHSTEWLQCPQGASGQECRYSMEWLQCPQGASGQECRYNTEWLGCPPGAAGRFHCGTVSRFHTDLGAAWPHSEGGAATTSSKEQEHY